MWKRVPSVEKIVAWAGEAPLDPSWLAKLTDKQFREWGYRFHRAIYKLFEGGTPFGVDIPTLNAVFPGMGAAYRLSRDEQIRRRLSSE